MELARSISPSLKDDLKLFHGRPSTPVYAGIANPSNTDSASNFLSEKQLSDMDLRLWDYVHIFASYLSPETIPNEPNTLTNVL